VVVPVLLQVVGVVGGGAVVGAAAAWALLRAARDTFGAGLDGSTVVVSVAVVLVLGLGAAAGAVRRVLRIDPIEATRPQEL
jgi:ABC-type antimicrobial peptide transport system permease subunit